MENVQNEGEELQRSSLDSQQQDNENSTESDEKNPKESRKPDETGTDPKRYAPQKFEKGTHERSGGDGTTESAAKKLDN